MKWDINKHMGMDFETSGSLAEYALQPWRYDQEKFWVTSLVWTTKAIKGYDCHGGLSGDDDPQRRDGRVRKMIHDMLTQAIAEKRTIVGWNLVYDISVCLAYGFEDLVYKCKWLDGMLLWKHYYIEPEYDATPGQRKSYGLKACVAEVLPQFKDYADDVDFHSTDPEARKILQDYNERDTSFSLYLTGHWFKKLAKFPQRLKCALIESQCLPQIAQANLEGMVIDTLATHELQQWLIDTAAARLEVLAPHGVTEQIVRSPTKMGVLMYDEWELPVLKVNTGKKTGKVTRATDKEVLHELAFKDPRAKLLREYREALNNKTKFADALLNAAKYNENGRAHPLAIVFGTYSGRFTYSSAQGKGKARRQTGFALHQEKRDSIFRSAVTPPPGYTLMEFDAAGQEFRWMAIASGDATMLGLCEPGEDPHMFMGAQIAQIGYKDAQEALASGDKDMKSSRQLGKVGNLSLQYRTSAKKLRVVARVQYNLPMELPEAQYIWKTYRASYPGVPEYWKQQIYQTRHCGYVETYAGRRVQVVGNWEGRMGWSMGSTAINYRIQGTGADQKYLAMMVLKDYMRNLGARFAWDLHDGLYWYVPNDEVERVAVDVRQMLLDLPYQKAWGFTPPIQLPWDCKTGHSWGTLEEWKD